MKIMIVKFSKGQISIEVIIVVIFLIIFLYTFGKLADITVNSLEVSKIKEQQQNIVLSLDDYFELQDGLFGSAPNLSIIDYNSSFIIPAILIPSQSVSCKIDINSNVFKISTEYNGEVIDTIKDISLDSTNYVLPMTFYCGQKINCVNNSNKLECS